MADNAQSDLIGQTTPVVDSAPGFEALLEIFSRFNDFSPLLRLTIAGGVIAGSLLLMLLLRHLIGRRIRHLDAIPEESFRPLRWQSQDLLSTVEMKNLWLGFWRAVGWLVSLMCGVGAV